MIIRLMNANFSANNIGELDKFAIKIHGSKYVSHTVTPTPPIDKGANVTITVTATSGTVASDFDVKMKNNPITPSITETSTGVFTITISNVTGNIDVLVGEASSGGGSEEGGDAVEVTFTTVNGSYVDSTGAVKGSANWNTTDYIGVKPNSIYTYYGNTIPGSSTVQAVYAYDSNKLPIKPLLVAVDATNGYIFATTEDTAYIRITSHKDTALKLQYTPSALLVNYVTNAYVAKDGSFSTASGWTRTDYIDVSHNRNIKYTGVVPEGGLSTVAAIYGYDSDKNPIEMVLAPSATDHVDGYTVTLTNDNIKYIAACAHTATGNAFKVETA